MKNDDCWIFVQDSKARDAFSWLSELIVDTADFYFHACMIDVSVRVTYSRNFNTLWHPLQIMSYHNMVWESLLQTGSDRCPVYLRHTYKCVIVEKITLFFQWWKIKDNLAMEVVFSMRILPKDWTFLWIWSPFRRKVPLLIWIQTKIDRKDAWQCRYFGED